MQVLANEFEKAVYFFFRSEESLVESGTTCKNKGNIPSYQRTGT